MFHSKSLLGNHREDLLQGAAVGLLGGLVASWVMNQFQTHVPASAFARVLGENGAGNGAQSEESQRGSEDEADPATVKAAQAVSTTVFHHELTPEEKKWAGPLVHYSFGAATGALYGAMAEQAPTVTRGLGVPFGAMWWLVADETFVPTLRLSQAPWKYPASSHVYALASHLVYGLTTEAIRRMVRPRLS
ncbi:MAG: DUF1440 domain-containing protein [Bradymonadaceae bacterium]